MKVNDLSQDVLREMWLNSSSEVKKVYSLTPNEDGDWEEVNFGNAEIKKVDGGWLYVDDQDGFEFLTQGEYELLDKVK